MPNMTLLLVISDVKEVFDLFDFWDGRDGLVDGAKVGDMLRCMNLTPTIKTILAHGGTKKLGMWRGLLLLLPTLVADAVSVLL